MVKPIALVLALVPAAVYAQFPPPLETVTGKGAITSSSFTRSEVPGVSTTETSGISAFTGPGGSVSRFPVQVTSSGVVYITTSTITLIPSTGRPTAPVIVQQNTNSPNRDEEGGTNRGAIAGGVIGGLAVIIAIVATLLWFRRRSPAHWKAKAGTWRQVGNKGPVLPTTASQTDFAKSEDKTHFPETFPPQRSTNDLHQDNPFKDPVGSPPPALYIREHRQPVHDPFADPLESPTSPHRPSHKRAASSVNPLLPPGPPT